MVKSSYNSNHPRKIQLSKSVGDSLIINCGLSLSIVGRDVFIKFINFVDPKFTIKDTAVAYYFIQRVLQGFNGLSTLGSDFMISGRTFPSVQVKDGYLTIFDIAQS